MTVKLNQAQWARLIEQRMKRYELEQHLERKNQWKKIRKYLSVPILIGIGAIWLYIVLFGWEWMMKGILNGIISATLIATILAFINAR